MSFLLGDWHVFSSSRHNEKFSWINPDISVTQTHQQAPADHQK